MCGHPQGEIDRQPGQRIALFRQSELFRGRGQPLLQLQCIFTDFRDVSRAGLASGLGVRRRPGEHVHKLVEGLGQCTQIAFRTVCRGSCRVHAGIQYVPGKGLDDGGFSGWYLHTAVLCESAVILQG